MSLTEADVRQSLYGGVLEMENREFVSSKELNQNRLQTLEDVVVLTDVTDADGLTSGALYEHEFDEVSILFAGYNSPDKPDVIPTLNEIVTQSGEINSLYISDLGQNGSDWEDWTSAVQSLVANGVEVFFRDHHQTPVGLREELSQHKLVDYVWASDTVESAASLVWREDVSNKTDSLEELVHLTKLRDLWMDTHPDFESSKKLRDAASWIGPDEYVSLASEHGVRFTEQDSVRGYLVMRSELREKKIELAVENASYESINDVGVAFVIGDCYQSEAASRVFSSNPFVEVVAVIKPTGKLSFRSRDGTDFAKRIAVQLGGGGHATEAGARLPVSPEMPDASEAKERIRSAFESEL